MIFVYIARIWLDVNYLFMKNGMMLFL